MSDDPDEAGDTDRPGGFGRSVGETPGSDSAETIVDRGPLERQPPRPTDDGRGFVLDPRPADDCQVERRGAAGGPLSVAGADGRDYPVQFVPDGRGGVAARYPVMVIETKVPYDRRPTRGLLDTDAQCAERGYRAVWQPLDPADPTSQLGAPDAPDDDPLHGVGVESWWSAWFTEDEVAGLRAAENTRSVTYETRFAPVGHPAVLR